METILQDQTKTHSYELLGLGVDGGLEGELGVVSMRRCSARAFNPLLISNRKPRNLHRP